MRIHSDVLNNADINGAALEARVDYDLTNHGSRSRKAAFNVLLTGESKRRPNSGGRGAGDDYAATWDQWGVFLAHLFDLDPAMKTPYYADRAEFILRTDARFTKIGGGWNSHWPKDAHGDHRFNFSGTPYQQECTKCSAVQRWGPRS